MKNGILIMIQTLQSSTDKSSNVEFVGLGNFNYISK